MVEGEPFYGIKAVARPAFWKTDGPTRAECHRPDKGPWKNLKSCPGPHPNIECTCGIHAWHQSKYLNGFHGERILACVVGWGQMYRHGSEGWRSEFAKPVALVRPRVEEGLLGTSAIEGIEIIANSLGARIFEQVGEMDHWARTCGRFSSWWTPEDEKRARAKLLRKQLPKPKGEG